MVVCVQVKVEMEQKMVHAQSLAVQEALNEANTQTNSKEVGGYVYNVQPVRQ